MMNAKALETDRPTSRSYRHTSRVILAGPIAPTRRPHGAARTDG